MRKIIISILMILIFSTNSIAAPSFGTASSYWGGGDPVTFNGNCMAFINSTQFIVAFHRDAAPSAYVKCGKVNSDKSITWGSEQQLQYYSTISSVCRVNDTTFAVSYSGTGSYEGVICRLGSVDSSNAITLGTAKTLESPGIPKYGNHNVVCTGSYVCMIYPTNSSGYNYVQTATYSGTTLSDFGNRTSIDYYNTAFGTNQKYVVAINDACFLMVAREGSSPFSLVGKYVTTSGGSPSESSNYKLSTSDGYIPTSISAIYGQSNVAIGCYRGDTGKAMVVMFNGTSFGTPVVVNDEANYSGAWVALTSSTSFQVAAQKSSSYNNYVYTGAYSSNTISSITDGIDSGTKYGDSSQDILSASTSGDKIVLNYCKSGSNEGWAIGATFPYSKKIYGVVPIKVNGVTPKKINGI